MECGRKDLEEYDGAVAALEGCGTKRAIAESEMQQRLAQPRELIKYVEGLAADYYKKGFDAPAALASVGAKWEQLTSQLATLQVRAEELKALGWQGTAAENYRSQLPSFSADVDKLSGLTVAASAGTVAATSELEDENQALLDLLDDAGRTVGAAAGRTVKSDWPDSSWWESDRNAEQYNFTFFTRCAEASRGLNDLTWAIIGRINDFNPNSNAAAEFTEVVKSLGGSVEDNGLSFCVGGPGPTDPGTGEMMA